MSVPLFDPLAEYRTVAADVDRAIREVVESGTYVLGPNVEAFEREMAAFLGAEHAVGVASGTDALVLSLLAAGIGVGDEVIVPAFSFVATAEVVARVGATPVFADVSEETGCVDPLSVAAHVGPATRALVPVHLYGHPADMEALGEIATDRNLVIVEDNAQGFGCRYDGRPCGSIGDAGCMSFFPTKTLGGFGDGGMIATSNPEIAERVRMLRAHGSRERGRPEVMGFNSRLDELQAAVLRVKLGRAEVWHARRREIAAVYAERFTAAGIRAPVDAADAEQTYGLYVIRLPERDGVAATLAESGIATRVYYPSPLPFAPAFDGRHRPGDFPVSEKLAAEVLAVPLFSAMSDEQVEEVASAVVAAVA